MEQKKLHLQYSGSAVQVMQDSLVKAVGYALGLTSDTRFWISLEKNVLGSGFSVLEHGIGAIGNISVTVLCRGTLLLKRKHTCKCRDNTCGSLREFAESTARDG